MNEVWSNFGQNLKLTAREPTIFGIWGYEILRLELSYGEGIQNREKEHAKYTNQVVPPKR